MLAIVYFGALNLALCNTYFVVILSCFILTGWMSLVCNKSCGDSNKDMRLDFVHINAFSCFLTHTKNDHLIY